MTLLQLNLQKIVEQFPIFSRPVNGEMLIYLDSAATTQKPRSVIECMQEFYLHDYATVHRGIYDLSMEATEKYDEAREAIKEFIHANGEEEIIFTKGTTDSINLVAQSFGEMLAEGDEIIITEAEHHSNIVPWHLLAKRKKITLRVVPIDDNGEIILEEYEKLLSSNTKLVSIAHIFNALGTINPLEEIISMAHSYGAKVLVDGAQAAAHHPIDVTQLDCDFYAFSAHKAYGPTGIGVLYGKYELLQQMPPVQGGGDMIDKVTLSDSTFLQPPLRFEAGTPAIAEAIAFKKAIDFLEEIGMENIQAHENHLLSHALQKLAHIPGLHIHSKAQQLSGIINFSIDGVHPLDLGTFLDLKGIAIRTGHHCAQPTLRRLGLESSARISFGIYNTVGEIDLFIESLLEVIAQLKK